MLLKFQKLEYQIVYKKNAEICIADTLSRSYLPVSDKDVKKQVFLTLTRSVSYKDQKQRSGKSKKQQMKMWA